MYWMVNDDVIASRSMDEADCGTLWRRSSPMISIQSMWNRDLIRRGTGFKDLTIEIVGTDPWVARLIETATGGPRLSSRRRMSPHPPFGGFNIWGSRTRSMSVGNSPPRSRLGRANCLRLTRKSAEGSGRTIAEAVINIHS
jgi:hypothetical protein